PKVYITKLPNFAVPRTYDHHIIELSGFYNFVIEGSKSHIICNLSKFEASVTIFNQKLKVGE
uniref:Uncharacterized protein n=1 Tax=Romanomermis culicivorax TaxID=13658 RepID=A0A915IQ70_ROMCU